MYKGKGDSGVRITILLVLEVSRRAHTCVWKEEIITWHDNIASLSYVYREWYNMYVCTHFNHTFPMFRGYDM